MCTTAPIFTTALPKDQSNPETKFGQKPRVGTRSRKLLTLPIKVSEYPFKPKKVKKHKCGNYEYGCCPLAFA